MNKLITTALVLAIVTSFVPSLAYAQKGPSEENKTLREEVKQEKQEFRQKVKEERKETRQEVKEAKKEMKFDIRQLFKSKNASEEAKKRGKAGKITGGTISSINGSSFTVTKDGNTYSVSTSDNTKFLRHFWGKSSLSELSVGNKVNVWGKWTDENKTALDAKMVRNLSVTKRHGVFFGQITSVGSGSFVIQTINRGDQTVTIGSAKLVNRKEQSITASDLKVGDRVRVKGLWDKATSKVTDVKQVKNFSLPKKDAKVTPTVTVTTTVTPTVAVTATPTPTP